MAQKSSGERATVQTLREVDCVVQSRERLGVRRPSGAFVRAAWKRMNKNVGPRESGVALRFLPQSMTLGELQHA